MRLSLLTGSYWIGSIAALIAFGLAHVPIWGWFPSLTTVVSGGLLTLLYLWTGDLLTCIIAHIVTDSVGIIMTTKITKGLYAGESDLEAIAELWNTCEAFDKLNENKSVSQLQQALKNPLFDTKRGLCIWEDVNGFSQTSTLIRFVKDVF